MPTKNSSALPYDFDDYRAFLRAALPVTGAGRGARAKLAEHLGCQSGFISQVLTGLADFSFEHAMKISRFLALGREEREFFLLLVHYGRAGSVDLREHYREQLDRIRGQRRRVNARIGAPRGQLRSEDRALYYSAWHFTAIHMCLVNPATQTRAAIVTRLGLGPAIVERTLRALVSMGLAEEKGGAYVGRYDRMHLPAESPLVGKHHVNWRMRAIASLDDPAPEDLHYSSVMSISPAAAEAVRNLLLEAVQATEPVVRAAKDEGVYALGLDLFRV